MDTPDTAIQPVATLERPQWELGSQLSSAWRIVKWSITALIVLGFLLVIGQGFLFYNMFAAIHPALGVAFVVMLAGVLILLVGRPLLSFFTTPLIANPPPPAKDINAPTLDEMATRLRYDLKYLSAMARNPNLEAAPGSIADDLAAGRDLLSKLPSMTEAEANAALLAFQTTHIEARLTLLDAKVDKLIHAEAVGVGVATAVSMNGTVDAFIVLWRNANLVARIARLYFGRPHLRGSLIILRDVAAIVVVSRAVEDITDMTGEVIGSILGRMGGLIAGPVMDGAINAMMTLKLGYLTKRRCRSYQGWSQLQASSITKGVLARVRRESTSVVTEILKKSRGLGASAVKAGDKVLQGSKSAWTLFQSWFGGRGTADKPPPDVA